MPCSPSLRPNSTKLSALLDDAVRAIGDVGQKSVPLGVVEFYFGAGHGIRARHLGRAELESVGQVDLGAVRRAGDRVQSRTSPKYSSSICIASKPSHTSRVGGALNSHGQP